MPAGSPSKSSPSEVGDYLSDAPSAHGYPRSPRTGDLGPFAEAHAPPRPLRLAPSTDTSPAHPPHRGLSRSPVVRLLSPSAKPRARECTHNFLRGLSDSPFRAARTFPTSSRFAGRCSSPSISRSSLNYSMITLPMSSTLLEYLRHPQTPCEGLKKHAKN